MKLNLNTASLLFDEQTMELTANKMKFVDELYVDYKVLQEGNYQRIQMHVHPKQDIVLKEVVLRFKVNYLSTDRIFCNGYQSWSESREMQVGQRIPRLKMFARPTMKYFGDEHIEDVPRGKGQLHSWTYSYVCSGQQFAFVGSLNEKTSFTLIGHDTIQQEMIVRADVRNLKLSHSFPLLDILVMEGTEQVVFDQYFDLMEHLPPKAEPLIGWTSWYHYYTNISEEIILKNLEAFASRSVPINIMQIDDGYQTRVGDWLSIKSSFPNGMASVAQKIKSKNYKAGLWIAPFICEAKSTIFQNRKNWLVKDAKGKPIKIGYNPLWSGWFYALDFYNKEVQDYIHGVIYTFLHKWNFDLLKMDFLYAACVIPRPNKTRGQIMNDAMTFLRNSCGQKLILGCGVPLGSAFGMVDYCRIGADIHLEWEHKFLKFLENRERVSTIIALRTTIGRWQLNSRAFNSDPDVFILRDNDNKLSDQQQYTILIINILLGNLLFTSDYVAEYTTEQWSEWEELYQWRASQVHRIDQPEMDLYNIHFTNQGINYQALCNLRTKKANIATGKSMVELEGGETLIMKSNG